MDVLNQFYVLAGLLPAEIEDLEGDLDAEEIQALAYLAGDLDAEIPAEGNFVIHPAADPLAAVAAVNDNDPQNPWKLVATRRVRRNGNNLPEPDVPAPPVMVCELECPWIPKVGSVCAKRKWSQARKSGFTGTAEGLARFTYGSSSVE